MNMPVLLTSPRTRARRLLAGTFACKICAVLAFVSAASPISPFSVTALSIVGVTFAIGYVAFGFLFGEVSKPSHRLIAGVTVAVVEVALLPLLMSGDLLDRLLGRDNLSTE